MKQPGNKAKKETLRQKQIPHCARDDNFLIPWLALPVSGSGLRGLRLTRGLAATALGMMFLANVVGAVGLYSMSLCLTFAHSGGRNMSELRPAPFRDLVTRLHREPAAQETLFGLPRDKWHQSDPDGPDLSVSFHGQRAGNPAGPAAGPHTQMAQNMLLSYVAGGRILELKTVQERSEPGYPAPCIELGGRRITCDWGQPLFITDALHEYVAGAMLIEMFRQNDALGGEQWRGLDGAVQYDVSVGYDLAGVSRDRVRGFLDSMRNAGAIVERLRAEIPKDFPEARGLNYPTRLAESVTLSAFAHCSADEIEKIGELLIMQHGFHLQIKLSPHILGRRILDRLLKETLGYKQLSVNPRLYAGGMKFKDAVQLIRRLQTMARRAGRGFSVKFCNPLEVIRTERNRPADHETLALTGPPLHVIALILANEVRRRVGPELATSFSAGVDRYNFGSTVACGFVPVTVCTDLLLEGGYARMSGYLQALREEMRECDAANIEELILKRYGLESEARRLAKHGRDESLRCESAVAWAAGLNTNHLARQSKKDTRYRAEHHPLVTAAAPATMPIFQAAAKEEVLPACPNAAHFTYPAPVVSFDYRDLEVSPTGEVHRGEEHVFTNESEQQPAYFADHCNACGVCEIRCEGGDPSSETLRNLPAFHRSIESWAEAAPHDGYVIHDQPEGGWIRARLNGRIYQLTYVRQTQQYVFDDGEAEALLTGWGHTPIQTRALKPFIGVHTMDMRLYHLLRYLREGVLNERQVNPINAQYMAVRISASGAPRI